MHGFKIFYYSFSAIKMVTFQYLMTKGNIYLLSLHFENIVQRTKEENILVLCNYSRNASKESFH